MLIRRITRPLIRGALARAGAGFDVAVVRAAQELAARGRRPQPNGERLAYLEGIAERYSAIAPADFYALPPPVQSAREELVRDLAGPGAVVDVSWPSGFVPHLDDARPSYLRWTENGVVRVRHFRHPHPAPTIVCIHGYRAGTFSFEERAWAAEWLFGLGLDVALFTLPFHALRAPEARRGTPLFPSGDVARTNDAFGHAVWDLRALIGWLRARGAPEVGVGGMSLGGYTTSLLATVEPSLSFAIPFIPLADLTDVVVEHEGLRGVSVPASLIEAGKRAMAIHRPLGRAPVVPPERILIVAAERDRITRGTHAELLARHFRAELVTFPGAHLLQFGRREGFKAIARFLAARGVIPSRSRRGDASEVDASKRPSARPHAPTRRRTARG